MNKRIKELAVQAGATVMERSGWTDYGTLELDVEKFAELIVQECAKVAWANTPDYEDLDYGHLIGDKIKERFGVE